MMTRTQLLLLKLMEECAELAQRCSKAMQFGLNEVQPGQGETNLARLNGEFNDLLGAVSLLNKEPGVRIYHDPLASAAKEAKIEHFYRYAQERGQVQ